MAKEKKKRSAKGHFMSICFFTVLGVILGLAVRSFMDWQMPEGISSAEKIFRMCVSMVMLVAAFMIHIVLHEAGHLIFGLMSGYRFYSFRIGSNLITYSVQKGGQA